jgi:hypothetical protein
MAMSVKTSSLVWEYSAQDGSKLIALLALADYAHDDGVIWIRGLTITEIARKMRRQVRRAQQIIAELVADGEVYAPTVHGRGKTTRYFVATGRTVEHIQRVLTAEFGLENTQAGELAKRMFQLQEEGRKKVQNVAPFDEKAQSLAPIKREKVQRVAPINVKKVQSPARKGAIPGQEKRPSGTSGRAASIPIRTDPHDHDSSDVDHERERVGARASGHWAVLIWTTAFPRLNLTAEQEEMIAERVDDEAAWNKTRDDYRGSPRWKPQNIGNVLDRYRRNARDLNDERQNSSPGGPSSAARRNGRSGDIPTDWGAYAGAGDDSTADDE